MATEIGVTVEREGGGVGKKRGDGNRPKRGICSVTFRGQTPLVVKSAKSSWLSSLLDIVKYMAASNSK